MKFKTHNDNIPWEGGSLQGYITVSYQTLTKILGKSALDFDDYKSDAEWAIKFEDGTYACIYNYKDGKNYLGKEGTPKTQITHWHIGGTGGNHAIKLIKEILNLN